MVSLHGFSVLILLTQSNHKSALLFSCTRPFSGACGYYTTFFSKSQTYVRIFLRKIKKFFRGYAQYRKERGGTANKNMTQPCNESPPAAREKAIRKRVSADAFSRRAFLSLRVFSSSARLGTAVLFTVCSIAFRSVFRRELVCGGAKPRRTRL